MSAADRPMTDDMSMRFVRPGRLALGMFIAALGLGVILLEILEEDAWSAVPFALFVAALAGLAGVVARHRSVA